MTLSQAVKATEQFLNPKVAPSHHGYSLSFLSEVLFSAFTHRHGSFLYVRYNFDFMVAVLRSPIFALVTLAFRRSLRFLHQRLGIVVEASESEGPSARTSWNEQAPKAQPWESDETCSDKQMTGTQVENH